MILQILLVEDNEAHAYLACKALESWTTPYKLHVVSSAEEALELLNNRNAASNVPLPHLALVDLHLPKRPGLAVVEAIKQSPELRNVVVMILTSSTLEADIQTAIDLHANAYFVKSMGFDKMVSLFETIEAFWRSDVRFAIPSGL